MDYGRAPARAAGRGKVARRVGGWATVAVAGVFALAASACAAAAASSHVVNGTTHRVPGTSYLLGVGCPPRGACIAVGRPSMGSSARGGIFLQISGGTPGTVQSVSGTSGLDHVACARANFCILVGEGWGRSSGSLDEVYVDVDHGKAGPARQLGGLTEASGIGCGSENSCWVTGAHCSGTACAPKVAHIVDGKLVKVYSEEGSYTFSIGGPATESSQRGARPACFSATTCTLAGMSDYKNPSKSSGLIFSLKDGKVKITHRATAVNLISGLGCTSADSCTLVGYNVSGAQKSEVLSLSAGKLGTPRSPHASVAPLACRSARACFAFGSKPKENSFEQVVVPIRHGQPSPPEAAGATHVYAATCTARLCLGVGNIGQYPNPEEGGIFSFRPPR